MTTEIIQPLSEAERRTYADCLQTIAQNAEGVRAVIRAMATVRNGQLYRETHTRFEDWLADQPVQIARTRQRAGQLINFVATVDVLAQQPGITVLPKSERQIRDIVSITDQDRLAAIWIGAQEASGTEQPSNTWVKSAKETLEQAEIKKAVHLGDGEEAPVTPDNFKKASANTELERVQRMIDHIRANRKTKPTAVFEGTFECSYEEDEGDPEYTMIARTQEHIKLKPETKYRFVVYEIPVPVPEPQEVQQ